MMLPLLLMRCYLACAKGETVTPHIPQCNVYRLFFCGVNAETWDADIDVISSPLRSSSKCRYFDTYRIQVWLWYDICQQNKTCSEVNLNNIILKFFPASVVYSKKKRKKIEELAHYVILRIICYINFFWSIVFDVHFC